MTIALNMCPVVSSNNGSNHLTAHSEHFSELGTGESSGRVLCSDCKDLHVCELCSSAFFAFLDCLPPLMNFVLGIIRRRAESQMRRVAASRCVDTGVQNMHSVWDWLVVVHHPSDSVGKERTFLRAWDWTGDLPVATFVERALPKPALVRTTDFDFRPKTIREFSRQDLRQQFMGYSVSVHQSVRLIVCHALGCANSARALLFTKSSLLCQAELR